jgi:hypothetical protein
VGWSAAPNIKFTAFDGLRPSGAAEPTTAVIHGSWFSGDGAQALFAQPTTTTPGTRPPAGESFRLGRGLVGSTRSATPSDVQRWVR